MGSRLAAAAIIALGLGALVWVAFGGNSTETAVNTTASAGAGPATSVDNDESGEPAPANEISTDSDPVGTSAAAESDDTESAPAATTTPEPTVEAPENFGPRMDLVEIDGWLNTDATSIDDFNGKVVLVEMWTFGCFNCKARIPYNQSYYEEFAGENFEIVGVHAPEFSYEADVANIVQAAEDLGVNWPIALDTNKKNFRAWQPGSTNFWPRTYVIDQNGDIRYDHIGEGKYEELRETIRFLIENPPAPKTNP